MLEIGSSDVCEKKLCCIILCYLYVRQQEGPEDSQTEADNDVKRFP